MLFKQIKSKLCSDKWIQTVLTGTPAGPESPCCPLAPSNPLSPAGPLFPGLPAKPCGPYRFIMSCKVKINICNK